MKNETPKDGSGRNGLMILLAFGIALVSVRAEGRMEAVITEFSADRRAVTEAYTVPWSEASLDRERSLLLEWRARVDGLDVEALSPPERIDWHLLRNHLSAELDAVTLDRQRLLEMEPLLGFRRPLQALLTKQAQRHDIDPPAAAGDLAQALTQVTALRKKLEQGQVRDAPAEALKPGPVLAVRAAAAMDRLRGALEEWFKFYHGFQPDFSWWMRQPQEALMKGLEETAQYLRQEIAGVKGGPDDPLIGDPIGAAALAAQIKTEMIPYNATELLTMAGREFDWCMEEMKKAAAVMGCVDGKAALTKLKEQHAPPGGQAELAAAEAQQAIRFVEAKELVTIPPLAAETWRLAMIGAEQQKSLPFAVYSVPRMLVAYAHESMSQEEKLMSMRGNNAAFLHIVTPHELIPGHHLQGFMAKRYAPHRQLFRTPFFVEGWALHWEMVLWDEGYAATPEQRAGALFWRMHRCARIIVSLKFHLGEMTPERMVDFLVDRVGHEKAGATAEVRRYIGGAYGPLYQAAYMLGGLQLRSLYEELTGPGKMTPREFHDRTLRENAIPVEMIRAALTNAVLPRDWKPDWRFQRRGP